MRDAKPRYIPALNQRWLTPLYDPVLKWLMQEDVFKRRLVAQVALAPGHCALDLGCGTGTLALMLKRAAPDALLVGLDGDLQVLALAQAKAARASLHLDLEQSLAFNLPFPDNCFDRVVSSLVYHHLVTADKKRTAFELFRVLRPGGELHIADFGPPHDLAARLIALAIRHLEHARDNVEGALPGFFRRAGFDPVVETGYVMTGLGQIAFLRAVKPSRSH